MLKQASEDKRLVLEMELQQARYDASLAERRYAACDPDSRLIALELEKRWKEALGRVRSYQSRYPQADKGRYSASKSDGRWGTIPNTDN